MKGVLVKAIACAAVTPCALVLPNPASAQIGVGTWVRQVGPATPGEITMTVEACCNGGRRQSLDPGVKCSHHLVGTVAASPAPYSP